jgi:ElaB/YqjD/DUF883 family membrane-anchored ribosome-binding protein
MMCRFACSLSLLVLSTARVPSAQIENVVSGTGQVIGTLQQESVDAKQRFANVSKFDGELDTIGRQAEAGFDIKLYAQRKEEFAKLAQRSMDISQKSLHEKNMTVAEEELDEAEDIQRNMTKVDSEIESMEKELHEKLQIALLGKLQPEIAVADKFSGQASNLQKTAHSMMNPLYSWGDAAEDKADDLNDQTNNALSTVEKLVRTYRRHIVDHSRTVQRTTERKLFRPGQDRGATSRKVNRALRTASGHVAVQKYLATIGIDNRVSWLLGLPLESTGSLTLLLTSMAAAAAVGALVASFVVELRAAPPSEYHLLSA